MARAGVSLQLLETKDFQRHLKRLARQGGVADFVHRQVLEALVDWSRGEDARLQPTHFGESRIAHVVKYDLKSRYRLVVYEHAGKRIPLMVGDHNDAEKWIEGHRGRDFAVDKTTQQIRYTIAATDKAATAAATGDVDSSPASRGPILERLPPEALEGLKIPQPTLKSLNDFATFEEVDDDRVKNLIEGLAFPSEEHRQVVTQVIALIARGEIDEAKARIRLFVGKASTATDSPEEFIAAIESGENSDVLLNLSDLSPDEIKRLVGVTSGGLTDWMLFLHPDQRRLVDRDYNGPARLLGVSGSGKTSVLIHRANALAKRYPGEAVLVLTLNSALAQLLHHLLDALCSPTVRSQIRAETLYDYCYRAVKTVAPGRRIERLDPRSGEDLKTCWQDFMEKPHALTSVEPIIAALENREDYVDGRAYLLDELVWIRSGFGRESRRDYFTADRPGRGIPLPKFDPGVPPSTRLPGGFPTDTRPRILRLLIDYEEYMHTGGLLDEDGVSLEASTIKEEICQHPSLTYRCVLVDEVQDCSTVELAVIAKIPTNPSNGLFLTGDPVQKVFAKQHDLVRAGIDIVGRAVILRKNYRNTRQILESAFRIITKFQELSPVPQAEILKPEYAFRDGPRPKLYECSSREEQVQLVMAYIRYLTPEELDGVCICSPAPETLNEFESACVNAGIATCRIRGTTARDMRLAKGVKLAHLQDVKGYEFGYVFLTDLMDTYVLPKGMPWEERWRSAFQIYVAMTRAREELIMTFIFNRSILLAPLEDTVEEASAFEMLEA